MKSVVTHLFTALLSLKIATTSKYFEISSMTLSKLLRSDETVRVSCGTRQTISLNLQESDLTINARLSLRLSLHQSDQQTFHHDIQHVLRYKFHQ